MSCILGFTTFRTITSLYFSIEKIRELPYFNNKLRKLNSTVTGRGGGVVFKSASMTGIPDRLSQKDLLM